MRIDHHNQQLFRLINRLFRIISTSLLYIVHFSINHSKLSLKEATVNSFHLVLIPPLLKFRCTYIYFFIFLFIQISQLQVKNEKHTYWLKYCESLSKCWHPFFSPCKCPQYSQGVLSSISTNTSHGPLRISHEPSLSSWLLTMHKGTEEWVCPVR